MTITDMAKQLPSVEKAHFTMVTLKVSLFQVNPFHMVVQRMLISIGDTALGTNDSVQPFTWISVDVLVVVYLLLVIGGEVTAFKGTSKPFFNRQV